MLTRKAILSTLRAAQAQILHVHKANLTRRQAGWPLPRTQQTISEFLEEINYFNDRNELKNIGVQSTINTNEEATIKQQNVEKLIDESQAECPDLDELGYQGEAPQFDLADAAISQEQLKNLALYAGIYRDLFSDYHPDRDHITFTWDQARRLDTYVPKYWITDLPFARAQRQPRPIDTIHYFEPVVKIHASFPKDEHAHVAYHGNIIPASEALDKPTIALLNRTDAKYHSVLMLNLDHLHENAALLHWAIANIQSEDQRELCDYLPVHGIEGFGYSRYVFVAMQHSSPLDRLDCDFALGTRKFDIKSFMESHADKDMRPVGLSWFQTQWDESSNAIFHDYIKIPAPVFEYIQPEPVKLPKVDYPKRVPFNIALDSERDQKDINEQVILARLKEIDPFESYKDQYEKPRVPPTIHTDQTCPSWMNNVNFKKQTKTGYWRGLRPASATLPLNNNTDLDRPIRPRKNELPEHHNVFNPRPRRKLLRNLPYSRPNEEHQSTLIQENHELEEDIQKIVKQFER